MSRSYSGTTEFEYELERVRESAAHEWRPMTDDDPDTVEYECFMVTVEGRSYYTPGRSFGPPENCYPDEGDTEILSVTGPDGKDWEDKLTSAERERILETITEKVSEDEGPDPDDYYDDYEGADDFEPYAADDY